MSDRDHFGELVQRLIVDLSEYLEYLGDFVERAEGQPEPELTQLNKHIAEVQSTLDDVSGWISPDDAPHLRLLMEWPTPPRSS